MHRQGGEAHRADGGWPVLSMDLVHTAADGAELNFMKQALQGHKDGERDSNYSRPSSPAQLGCGGLVVWYALSALWQTKLPCATASFGRRAAVVATASRDTVTECDIIQLCKATDRALFSMLGSK